MAGAGYKLFNTGDVLTAAQVNTYLQEQVVMVFNDATARTTALSGVLAEGMVTYLKDTDALEIYSGTAWVGYGSGDITGVTAGTGISGGGTSGTVTITNSMATEITAAGDIIVGTGSGTFDNLPIGTTGQVLTADTTVSPYKVKWASAASSFKGVYLTKSASQSIPATTYTAITWDTESFDTDAFHSTTTNTSRITIPSGLAGYYSIYYQVYGGNGDLTGVGGIAKNGTRINSFAGWKSVAMGSGGYSSHLILNLAVGDYIETLVYATNTLTIESNAQNAQPSVMWAQYLGA